MFILNWLKSVTHKQMFILLETYNFPKIILFRHEQYTFQKDLVAQLKLSGDYVGYTLPALEIPQAVPQ